MNPNKVNVINILQLIGDVEAQEKYYIDVPIAHVPTELINQWFDDFFHPESDFCKELFSKNEWRILMEFNNYYDVRVDKLPVEYEKFRESPVWKDIVEKANLALNELGWKNIEAKY